MSDETRQVTISLTKDELTILRYVVPSDSYGDPLKDTYELGDDEPKDPYAVLKTLRAKIVALKWSNEMDEIIEFANAQHDLLSRSGFRVECERDVLLAQSLIVVSRRHRHGKKCEAAAVLRVKDGAFKKSIVEDWLDRAATAVDLALVEIQLGKREMPEAVPGSSPVVNVTEEV